jgi:hypothetical protein
MSPRFTFALVVRSYTTGTHAGTDRYLHETLKLKCDVRHTSKTRCTYHTSTSHDTTMHAWLVNKFDKRAETLRDSHGVIITVSHHARIVDDILLVSSSMTVSHPRGDAASLRRSINETYGRTVCAHIGMLLPELAASPNSAFLLCEGAFGSCPFCLTDYRIDISWQGERMVT